MSRLSELREGSHLNSVWLEGTLTSDPVEVQGADPGSCQFAVLSPWASDPPSEFVVHAAGSAFDGNRPRIRAGKRVRVIGRLRQRRWRDAQGTAWHEVEVVSELVELAGSGGVGSERVADTDTDAVGHLVVKRHSGP